MFTRNCSKLAAFSRIFFDHNCSSHFSRTLICSAQPHRSYETGTDLFPGRNYNIRSTSKTTDHFDSTINKLKSTELLEKLIASLSKDFYQKNRVYKNDLIRIINKIKESNFSTKKQGLFLIQCCTELLPDESPSSRMSLVEEIWQILKPHTKFDVDHYNQLLKVYIANNRTVVASSFIQKMAPIKPNITTYELIILALAEVGDINQATEVISNMKSQGLPATENILNALILCQGKAGYLQNMQEVLTMMKSLKIEPSVESYTQIVRSHAWNKNDDQIIAEMSKAQSLGIQFTEKHIMDIVKTLAAMQNNVLIPQVLRFLPAETLNTPSISPLMQSVCTQLVFQGNPLAALDIYKCLPLPSFGPKDDTGLHGRSLVRDCVKASVPISVIGLITQELMSSGRNVIALECACEAALQLGKVPMALDIFGRMKQLGLPIRPHYFWPLLVHSAISYGEKGIMNMLKTMVEMDVPPDYETVTEYVMPYVSLTSPQNLMKKFTEVGLSVTTVLTGVMVTLLQSGQIRAASEIGEVFHGKIDGDKLIKPLLKGYLMTLDSTSTIYILEDLTKKATQQNKDWVGRFLCEHMQHKKVQEDISDYFNILKELNKKKLQISTAAADFCITRLPSNLDKDKEETIKKLLMEITDERLVDEIDIYDRPAAHPNQMDEPTLKAHLIELEAKGMNTRGVLRKLLQLYCREGNLTAAKEIVEKCKREGVFLSAGMKASIFDLQIKMGELEQAEMSLADLNRTTPSFMLDEFKVIDFATLMVYRGFTQRAMDLIIEQTKKRRVIGGRSIEMNCWRLLDAMAANASCAETRQMFQLLLKCGYCKPTNTLLGPLIRVHLKNNDITAAVNEFIELGNMYKKTPLKHELICTILSLMNDGHTEENFLNNEKANGKLNKLLQSVLNVDRTVHGAGDVPLTLIVALAEVGYTKTLRKLLLDPKLVFHPEALLRRCERFAYEKKVAALETIAECVKERRNFKVEDIYELILSVYKRDDDTSGALRLWNKIQEDDVTVSGKFIENICSLLTANKREIPSDLAILNMKSKKVNKN